MGVYETFFHILLGVAIGYVIGRFHCYLRDIKEELDEVDDIVKTKIQDERGFMRFPIAADIAVVITVLLCVWAAFSTQITNNKLEANAERDDIQQVELAQAQADLKDAQEAIERLSTCNSKYLTQTVVALNERTKYTQERANANVQVQKAQSRFWKFLLVEPPPSDAEGRAALEHYLTLIDEFVDASKAAAENVKLNPYPTDDDLAACYNDADDITEEDKNATE